MVFNVPAESVGALSILSEFYNEVRVSDNYSTNWIFVLGSAKLDEVKNIQVINYPWIKKSWFHRIFFDYIIAPKLVQTYKIDKIISFQNSIIPFSKKKQLIYFHNSLPFSNFKFSIIKDFKLWLYKKLISINIKISLRKAEKIIVQTNWIKNACINILGIEEQKIKVITPNISSKIELKFISSNKSLKTFFYPASAFSYKNHKVIFQACQSLIKSGYKDFQIILTVTGDENKELLKYKEYSEAQNLPIKFIGPISREKVYEYYSKSILIFPSMLETFGLPLLESKLHSGLIIASDTPFSNEILNNYKNAYFFKAKDFLKLSSIMEDLLIGKINYFKCSSIEEIKNDSSLINEIYKM